MPAEEPPPPPPSLLFKPPENMSALAKLGWQIRVNKYKPSPQESEALGKCFEDAKWYYMNGPLAAGALVWTSTGGTRLKAFPRVMMTASAAVIGHDLGGRIAGKSCMKKLLSLEGSPLRGELIAILRRDFPDHPLLKSELVERQPSSMSQSLYAGADEIQNLSLPTSDRDWARRIDDRISTNLNQEEQDSDGELRRISPMWKDEPKQAAVETEPGSADLLADPFDLVMPTGFDEDPTDSAHDGRKRRPGEETRRSRMSVKERREYDRQQYERWEQKQQKL